MARAQHKRRPHVFTTKPIQGYYYDRCSICNDEGPRKLCITNIATRRGMRLRRKAGL